MFTDDDDDDSSDEDYDEDYDEKAHKLGQLIYRSMSQSTYNAKFIGTC